MRRAARSGPCTTDCHLGLGRLYRRVGERQKAEEQVAIAVAMYRDMDMRFWVEKAAAEATT